ncbi:hypothetical protein ACEN2T_13315, partial [Pseudomonas sp. W22_MBD1_FP4]|uniref:hypothetical protein n=1 Tax=Pseudomonas sp. W22_MBD1_FP4 TaxID=3240272 RepID=UPI003F9C8397
LAGETRCLEWGCFAAQRGASPLTTKSTIHHKKVPLTTKGAIHHKKYRPLQKVPFTTKSTIHYKKTVHHR